MIEINGTTGPEDVPFEGAVEPFVDTGVDFGLAAELQRLAREPAEELLRQYHDDGNDRAKETLVKNFLPLARMLARKYAAKSSEELDDLTQVATIGLLRSIDRFDASRECTLSTFAVPTIEGELRHHLRGKSRGIHVPRSAQESEKRMRSAAKDIQAREGREPSLERLAEELGLTEEEALDTWQVMRGSSKLLSLDVPYDFSADGGEGQETLVNTLADPHTSENFDKSLQRLDLINARRKLPKRLRNVIAASMQGLTQAEIGEHIGVSQMQVSRDLRKAIGLLAMELAE